MRHNTGHLPCITLFYETFLSDITRGCTVRVLIAEDDPTSNDVLRINLETWGYDVVAYSDGAQAYHALQQPDAPRLAILDWMMPELSGVEVCRQVRSQEQTHQPYIILLTAKSQRTDLIEGLKAGADDYIAKPFDRQELRARLQVGIRVIELQDQLLQAEQMRVLAQTAGAAAHEINQPLTILLGKLELILDRLTDTDPLRQDLTDTFRAGQRIADIVMRMNTAQRYVTKPYIEGVDIVDFDASSKKE